MFDSLFSIDRQLTFRVSFLSEWILDPSGEHGFMRHSLFLSACLFNVDLEIPE